MTVQSMYIGEISTDDSRGALGSFMQLFIVIGILYVNCVGPYVSYVMTQWICLIIPVAFAVTFWFMPETPYYYIGKGKRTEATKSLAYLRGKSVGAVKEEMEVIEASVQESMQETGRFVDLFINKGNLKALIISCGLISFQQLSGINAILFYTKTIFEKTGSSLDPALATILVCAVQVLASGLTPLIVDRLGRKLILLISAAGMCLSLALFGVYFYMVSIESDSVPKLGWLPVTSLIAFVAVYCIGFGPLPWAVLGEMFPSNVKGIASSVVASTCWILGFLVAKYYSAMDEAVGSHWAFWIFGICCATAFVFTYTLVFETKGMSLKQIQDKLNGR